VSEVSLGQWEVICCDSGIPDFASPLLQSDFASHLLQSSPHCELGSLLLATDALFMFISTPELIS
jgi:hypothetical protein